MNNKIIPIPTLSALKAIIPHKGYRQSFAEKLIQYTSSTIFRKFNESIKENSKDFLIGRSEKFNKLIAKQPKVLKTKKGHQLVDSSAKGLKISKAEIKRKTGELFEIYKMLAPYGIALGEVSFNKILNETLKKNDPTKNFGQSFSDALNLKEIKLNQRGIEKGVIKKDQSNIKNSFKAFSSYIQKNGWKNINKITKSIIYKKYESKKILKILVLIGYSIARAIINIVIVKNYIFSQHELTNEETKDLRIMMGKAANLYLGEIDKWLPEVIAMGVSDTKKAKILETNLKANLNEAILLITGQNEINDRTIHETVGFYLTGLLKDPSYQKIIAETIGMNEGIIIAILDKLPAAKVSEEQEELLQKIAGNTLNQIVESYAGSFMKLSPTMITNLNKAVGSGNNAFLILLKLLLSDPKLVEEISSPITKLTLYNDIPILKGYIKYNLELVKHIPDPTLNINQKIKLQSAVDDVLLEIGLDFLGYQADTAKLYKGMNQKFKTALGGKSPFLSLLGSYTQNKNNLQKTVETIMIENMIAPIIPMLGNNIDLTKLTILLNQSLSKVVFTALQDSSLKVTAAAQRIHNAVEEAFKLYLGDGWLSSINKAASWGLTDTPAGDHPKSSNVFLNIMHHLLQADQIGTETLKIQIQKRITLSEEKPETHQFINGFFDHGFKILDKEIGKNEHYNNLSHNGIAIANVLTPYIKKTILDQNETSLTFTPSLYDAGGLALSASYESINNIYKHAADMGNRVINYIASWLPWK